MQPLIMEHIEKIQQDSSILLTGSIMVIKICGLFVPIEDPWIAATPDGLVLDPNTSQTLGLVENKNPHSLRDKTTIRSCQTLCILFRV